MINLIYIRSIDFFVKNANDQVENLAFFGSWKRERDRKWEQRMGQEQGQREEFTFSFSIYVELKLKSVPKNIYLEEGSFIDHLYKKYTKLSEAKMLNYIYMEAKFFYIVI